MRSVKTGKILTFCTVLASLLAPGAVWAQEREFDLPAQAATRSIPEFAQQANIQIVAPGRVLRGVSTVAIKGHYDVRAALALLLEGTGLRIVGEDGATITLGAAPSYTAASRVSGTPALRARAANTVAAPVSESAGRVDSLEEVTVTAERRESALHRTPLSVGTVTGDELVQRGVGTLRDLTGNVPGLVTPGYYPNMTSIYIRGIGTTDPGVLPAVGVYVDDVYVPRTFGNGVFGLPDIERVEVLRGPQGTLYGQNTSAGAIKIISLDPGKEPRLTVSGRFGNLDAVQGTLYAAAPLREDLLSASLAYARIRRDGFTYNSTIGRWIHEINTDQARLKFKLTPHEDWDVVLSAEYTRDDSDNAVSSPNAYPGGGPRLTFAGTDSRLHREINSVALRATGRLNDRLTFRSITATRGFKDDPSPWDSDGTPAADYGWTQFLDERQYSQEFQLLGDYGRFSFTTGIVGFRERFKFDRITTLLGSYSEIDTDLEITSGGIYAQGDYRITDTLKLTLGARFSAEEQDFSNGSYRTTADGTRLATIYGVEGLEDSSDSTTAKVGLAYQINPDWLLYGSYTQGVKSGGFNRAAGTEAIARIPVDPEQVGAFEIGSKALIASRAQLSASLFYNDFRDYQANVANPVIDGVPISGNVVVNAGKAHTYGVELDGSARLVDGLTFSANVSYLRTRFDSFLNPTGAAAADYAGNELPQAPRWQGGARASYVIPFVTTGAAEVGAAVRYQDEAYTDVANAIATVVDAQTYADFNARYTFPGERWELSFAVRNAFDRMYKITKAYSPAVRLDTTAYNPPREWLLGVRYDFR